jgi:hypothetical protein
MKRNDKYYSFKNVSRHNHTNWQLSATISVFVELTYGSKWLRKHKHPVIRVDEARNEYERHP